MYVKYSKLDCSLHSERPHASNGFALVIALSLMAFILLLLLSTTTLVRVETVSSTQAKDIQEARENAQLGLMIAIGELQEAVGPDQRVTASADIHEARSDGKKHITGVWSTKDWEPTSPNDKEFVSWLATIPTANNDAELEDIESALAPFSIPGSELITIVGDGSLGSSAPAEDRVRVATVPIIQNNAHKGSYAYWVGDDSIKASYAIAQDAIPDAWNEAAKTTTPYRTGIELIDSTLFGNYPSLVKTPQINAHSRQSINLNHLSASGNDSPSQKYFHDFTNRSISLLTNTRDGGLKHDLSTAFELDQADFDAIEEFHNSIEKNFTANYSRYGFSSISELYPQTHALGYLFEIPVSGTNNVLRGPTWDLLRNHYRLYKKEWDSFAWARSFNANDTDSYKARGMLPLSYAHTVGTSHPYQGREYGYRISPGAMYLDHSDNGWDHGFRAKAAVPISTTFDWRTGLVRPTAARIAPTITRVTFVLGARKIGSRLAFSLDPYITIHNPYNRKIEFESIGMYASKFNPVRVEITYTPSGASAETTTTGQFAQYYNSTSALAYRLLPPSGGTFTLEPGEIKVLSPTPQGGTQQEIQYSSWSHNFIESTLNYGEDTGLFSYLGKNIQPEAGTNIKLTMSGHRSSELDAINFSLYSSKRPNGTTANLKTDAPPGNMGSRVNVEDEDSITRMTFLTEANQPQVVKSFNVANIPSLGQAGFYVGALDISMKHGNENAPVFHQFNPRGQVYDHRNYDGSNGLGPAWKVEVKAITDISDLNLVADTEGHAFWGGGATAGSGTSKVVLYELPRAPLTALSSLSHADISIVPEDGTSQIGNSFIPAGFADPTKLFYKRPKQTSLTNPRDYLMHTLSDFSWASNEMLWDQYFFSSMNWGDTSLAYQTATTQTYTTQQEALDKLINGIPTESPLTNPRIRYMPSFSTADTQDEMKDYSKIAKYLAVVGGFNVNSTSVEAWKAVLGAHYKLAVDYLANNGSVRSDSNSGVPFSRFQLPAGTKNDTADDYGEWSGYRTLSESEITELAESIVKQVKLRGPFMGLSDFVNRRLQPATGSTADVDKLGALQMAIEATIINDSLRNPTTLPNIEDTSFETGEGSKKISTLTGAPGYLMQSDVLNSIGSILRTRSDTFTIRAYGEKRDLNNKVVATAWCEATVQRTPEWIEPSTTPFKELIPNYHTNLASPTVLKKWQANSAVSELNQRLGRKLQIISLRWLSPDEI